MLKPYSNSILSIMLILALTITWNFSCSKDEQILPCLPMELSDHVLVYYPFSNMSLKNIKSSSNQLNNVNNVEFTSDRQNNPNCAVLFDKDENQYLSTDASFLNKHQSKEFSISLWYKPLGDKNDFELLVGRSSSKITCPDKHGEWSLGLYDCRRVVASINKKSIWSELDTVWINATISGPNKCKIESNNNTATWKHIVFTYKNEIRKIYISGKLQKRNQSSGCGLDSKNVGDLIIGKLYNGIIDDIIIFDKELSTSEVLALYDIEPCCL